MPTKLQELLQENCYIDKMERWLAFFPADRFILIKSEDLRDEGSASHSERGEWHSWARGRTRTPPRP